MANNICSLSSPPRGEQQAVQSLSKSARYFVIKLQENFEKRNTFTEISPFLINKTFISVLGKIPSIKKLLSGDLLVEVSTLKQAQILSKSNKLGPFSVFVSQHASLNSSRGVISEPELLHSTETEILENLQSQHVCGVRRITIRREGNIIPTKHIILTFDTPSLPSRLKVAYLSCPVRPYIPNPLRCFQCQRFGHSKASCRGSVTCARCAEVGHEAENCTSSPRCVNCKGEHQAYSRSCPKWTFEKEVQSLKTMQKLSYPEARRLVESRTPTVGVTYSAALKKQTKSIAVQTDLQSAFTQTDTAINSKLSTQQTLSKSSSPNITPTPHPNPTLPKLPITQSTAAFNPHPLSTNLLPTIQPTAVGNNRNSSNPAHDTGISQIPKKLLKKKKKLTASSSTFTYKKRLTKEDFLENRPQINMVTDDEEECIKGYASSEDDMLTDGSHGSQSEVHSTAPS